MSGRSGCASSAALRPAFACDPACGGTQPGVRTLAVPLPRMRRSVGASVSTRRSGRSVPARSGAMAPAARGADFTPALPHAADLLELFRQCRRVTVRVRPNGFWEGGIHSATRVPAAMSPEAAGHRAGVSRWGVAGVVSYEQRGAPPWDVPARSQPEESRSAASGGEQATRGRAPAWQWKTPRSGKQIRAARSHPRRRQRRSRYAVTKKKPGPSPWGKRKPPRSGMKGAGRTPAWQERVRKAMKPR